MVLNSQKTATIARWKIRPPESAAIEQAGLGARYQNRINYLKKTMSALLDQAMVYESDRKILFAMFDDCFRRCLDKYLELAFKINQFLEPVSRGYHAASPPLSPQKPLSSSFQMFPISLAKLPPFLAHEDAWFSPRLWNPLVPRRNVAKKRRPNHASHQLEPLEQWFNAHANCPYPTMQQKHELCSKSGLSYEQVSHWFINARTRGGRTMEAKQKEAEPDVMDAVVRLEELLPTLERICKGLWEASCNAAIVNSVGITK